VASRVSVVIPTKNGADTLDAVLAGLFAQKRRFELEVVVIDSGSTDGTLAIAERHPVRLERIAPHEYNHGATRNLGIGRTTGDPVVLLVQDAIPADESLLENLVRPFEDPRVAGVYGRQIARADCDVVRRRQLEGWLTGRLSPARVTLDGVSLAELPPQERYERCVFDNVCSAVRRSVWERVPFPRIPFGEDVAWSRAVLEAGHAIAYEPTAAVIHSHRRPVAEEYRRERLSHRTLFEQFGIAVLPRRSDVWRGVLWHFRNEVPYAWRHAPRGAERWRQLARMVGLAFAVPLGQHHGVRAAQRAARDGID
jgi:rhamnosyltransferase